MQPNLSNPNVFKQITTFVNAHGPLSEDRGRALIPTSICVYVPAIFDPYKFKSLAGMEQEALWLVGKVTSLPIHYRHSKKNHKGGYYSISQQTIEQRVTTRISRPLQIALKEAKVIECNETYIQGGYSKGWRLAAPYKGRLRQAHITKKALINRIVAHRISINGKPVKEPELQAIDRHLLSFLRRLKLNQTASYSQIDLHVKGNLKRRKGHAHKKVAKSLLQEIEYRRDMCRMTVNQICNPVRDIDYKICRQGRRHTPVSRLISIVRPFLSIDNKKLINLDLANSQLIFFVIILKQWLTKKNIQNEEQYNSTISPQPPPSTPLHHPLGNTRNPLPDIENAVSSSLQQESDKKTIQEQFKIYESTLNFIDRVMDGTIYDSLIELYQNEIGKTVTRAEFKHGIFFKDVIFGNNTMNYINESDMSLLFQAEYPQVYEFILDQKKWRGHGLQDNAFKQLALRMQRMESSYMFNQVVSRLYQYHSEIPIITIHDSIMTTSEYVDTVARIMSEEFARLHVKPTIRIEK